jgi:hypothetical protein
MSFGFGSGGFGQNNQPSNTFGGGGFGANTNNTTPGTYFHVIFLAVILVPFFFVSCSCSCSCSRARPQPSPASADTMLPTTSLRIQHSCVWRASADNQPRGRPLWWGHHRWLWQQYWGYDTSLSFERRERRVSLVDVVLGGLTALPWNAPDVFSTHLIPLSPFFQAFLYF